MGIDDKTIAIIALTIIAIAVIFKVQNPQEIVIAVISAIAGFVSGRITAKNEGIANG